MLSKLSATELYPRLYCNYFRRMLDNKDFPLNRDMRDANVVLTVSRQIFTI